MQRIHVRNVAQAADLPGAARLCSVQAHFFGLVGGGADDTGGNTFDTPPDIDGITAGAINQKQRKQDEETQQKSMPNFNPGSMMNNIGNMGSNFGNMGT